MTEIKELEDEIKRLQDVLKVKQQDEVDSNKVFFRSPDDQNYVLWCQPNHDGSYWVINGAWNLEILDTGKGKVTYTGSIIDIERMTFDTPFPTFKSNGQNMGRETWDGGYNAAIAWAIENVTGAIPAKGGKTWEPVEPDLNDEIPF